jgi:hypothetical protein
VAICDGARPTLYPTESPVPDPTDAPVVDPTGAPVVDPTDAPVFDPTGAPVVDPTESPSTPPTESPSKSPTKSPTKNPTKNPTAPPTESPSKSPTKNPTKNPTAPPTESPTKSPTKNPTKNPTAPPTESPSKSPTKSPTKNPTKNPTESPTLALDLVEAGVEDDGSCACETNTDDDNQTWKCGNDVYVSPAVTTICSVTGSVNSKYYLITQEECELMKKVAIGEKCLPLLRYGVKNPKGLSNRVCYSRSDHGMKEDGTCDTCKSSKTPADFNMQVEYD